MHKSKTLLLCHAINLIILKKTKCRKEYYYEKTLIIKAKNRDNHIIDPNYEERKTLIFREQKLKNDQADKHKKKRMFESLIEASMSFVYKQKTSGNVLVFTDVRLCNCIINTKT